MKPRYIIAAILGLAGLSLLAQEYLSRQPTPPERERVAGVARHIRLDFGRITEPTWASTNYTVQSTNGIILCKNVGFVLEVDLPNASNNWGRVIEVVAVGATQVKLTNSSFGNLFTEPTNETSAVSFTLNSNRSARVVATSSNWFVVPY